MRCPKTHMTIFYVLYVIHFEVSSFLRCARVVLKSTGYVRNT